MTADLDGPVPELPSELSPSAINDLFECPLRMAFRFDRRFAHLRRPSQQSALGLAAHAVVEALSKGLLRGVSEAAETKQRIRDAWDVHIEAQANGLAEAWAPSIPPEPEQWPGYHLTRARVFRRAMRYASTGALAGYRPPLAIEVTLSDVRLGLRGRPDRVEEVGGKRCVVDLKTGLQQSTPTAYQRRQLLVYAHLVRSATGELPSAVAIEDASGRRWEEAVDVEEVESLLTDFRDRRREFDSAVRSSDIQSLASTDAGTCRWCPYRISCPAYWTDLSISWEHGAAAGKVTDVVHDQSRGVLEMEIESPADDAGTLWVLTGVSRGPAAKGEDVAVVNAERLEARHLRWQWATILQVR